MRTLLTLLTFLVFSAFSNPAIEASKSSKDANFSWLLGSWQRINDKEGQQTFEHWKQASNELYLGMGCTLKDGDTIWKEDIRLRKVEKKWYFEVTGQGEDQATSFILTEINDKSFICKNPENEFPKVISYKESATGLIAEISGGGPHILFEFNKID